MMLMIVLLWWIWRSLVHCWFDNVCLGSFSRMVCDVWRCVELNVKKKKGEGCLLFTFRWLGRKKNRLWAWTQRTYKFCLLCNFHIFRYQFSNKLITTKNDPQLSEKSQKQFTVDSFLHTLADSWKSLNNIDQLNIFFCLYANERWSVFHWQSSKFVLRSNEWWNHEECVWFCEAQEISQKLFVSKSRNTKHNFS